MEYNNQVIPYLNTTQELDISLQDLLSHWSDDSDIDLESATEQFFQTAKASPNINNLDIYTKHCILVSEKCMAAGVQILLNDPTFAQKNKLDPRKLAFMGLIEDSFYMIGGNGKNNQNHIDSNPYHEILTYIQLKHMGYHELADGMAMHFVAHEILADEHSKGRFLDINPSTESNLTLDILTAVDALCTTEYLPDRYGNVKDALIYRIDDVIERRSPDHPLTIALEHGGREKLIAVVQKYDKLIKMKDYQPTSMAE